MGKDSDEPLLDRTELTPLPCMGRSGCPETVYVTVHVRILEMGERTQFHTLGLGKNPRKYWILVKSGIADHAYKAAALHNG